MQVIEFLENDNIDIHFFLDRLDEMLGKYLTYLLNQILRITWN